MIRRVEAAAVREGDQRENRGDMQSRLREERAARDAQETVPTNRRREFEIGPADALPKFSGILEQAPGPLHAGGLHESRRALFFAGQNIRVTSGGEAHHARVAAGAREK